MIKTTIRKKYMGLYPIRDKYTKQAELEGVGLEITVEETGEIIVIPKENLRSAVKFSKDGFRDHYSNEVHSLLYYTKVKNENNLSLNI